MASNQSTAFYKTQSHARREFEQQEHDRLQQRGATPRDERTEPTILDRDDKLRNRSGDRQK